jgi:fluoroacetyl-CoA thioesterase
MARVQFTVTDQDTASALGSGDLAVLATPRLLAWLEAATVCAAAELVDPTETTVGTRVELEHLAASGVGAAVTAVADLAARDGRLLRFAVAAHDGADRLLAAGTVTRVVVDRDRFLSRVPRPAT